MLGSPKPGQELELLLVRREVTNSKLKGKDYEWLICNGMSMGRWTLHFGVHCLADDGDNKLFAENIFEGEPTAQLLALTMPCNFEVVREK